MKKKISLLGMLALSLLIMGQGCVSLSPSAGAGSAAGVFVSTDNGETWQPLSALPEPDGVQSLADVSVYRFVNDPEDSRALYWLSRERGMFYSYNEGRLWRTVEGPLASGFVYALAVHPGDKCTLIATSGSEVYQSTDCSRSWQEIYRESRTDVRVASLAYSPFAPYVMYLAESNGDLLASRDSGNSWQVVKRFEAPLVQVEVDPFHENLIYVASRANGLYRSGDGGKTWAELKTTMSDFSGALEYRRFLVHPGKTDVLYWISTFGVLVSNDRGDNWKSIDLITPPGSAQIYGFAINAENDNEMYYTATINNRSTFYKSVDGGKHWTTNKLPSGYVPTALRVHPERSNVLYLGFTIPPKE